MNNILKAPQRRDPASPGTVIRSKRSEQLQLVNDTHIVLLDRQEPKVRWVYTTRRAEFEYISDCGVEQHLAEQH